VISEQNKNITEQWKEDSLILKAKELLDLGKTAEALPSFQRAYDQNPEHYYLANFIRHLEFIQSQEYEKLKPVFDMYLGEYENEKLYREKDKIYYKDQYYDLYELLPLSETEFMCPSLYNTMINVVKEKNSIRGLKFIYRDGTEEFVSRKN
jgi:hypothetical protein